MFSHKTQTICNAWLEMVKYNDQYLQSKNVWVNEQHEFILAADRWALKNIKQTAKKTALHVGCWPVFLIELVGNSHIHIRDCMIGVKVMLDESVV